MKPRIAFRRLVESVASLLALVVLAIGVPIALWRLVGWPLPAGIPSVGEIRQALANSDIPDSALFKTIALVGWCAWLQVAASLIVEVVAWVRGRPAPRIRTASALQPAVRRLVASAALLAGSVNLPQPSPALPLRLEPAVATTVRETQSAVVPATVAPRVQRTANTETPSASVGTKTYTVVRYDTLWGLAEDHLGDPFRWREIYALNRGMRQPDGRALEDPDLIVPGWTLAFPADATGLPTDLAVEPSAAPEPTGPETNKTPVPPIAPSSEPECATVPTTSAGAASPTASITTIAPASAPRESQDHSSDDDNRGIDPALLVGGGLAAAGLVALLDRLRRVQRRNRRPGVTPHLPSEAVERIERQLRRAADLDAAELVDLATRAFAAGATDARDVPPSILAVLVRDGRAELLTEQPPHRAPRGFVVADHDRGWITDPDLTADDLRTLAAGAAAPLPALVALGDLDGGRLLVDIEAAGTFTVAGPPEQTVALIRRIATELATSTWVDHVDILVVGSMELDIAGAERVRNVPDLDAALEELAVARDTIAGALESAECETTLAARFSESPDDGWIPTILLCADRIEHRTLERLKRIVGDGRRGVGAVVPSTEPARWHAAFDGNELTLSPLGFRVTPGLLDLATADALDELFTDAEVGEPPEFVREDAFDGAAEDPTISVAYEDPPFDIEVRVLGTVEIVGSAGHVDRRRSIEIATYLALHPKGVTDDRLKSVVWPDEAPTTATFNTTVSMTRSRLGRADDGTPHFPHFVASGGLYRLGPLVTTDFARFEARVEHARNCTPVAAMETLRSALNLVRGKPFDGARGFEWAFSEGIIANIEATVADAAHRLAQLYLEAGDANGATWAAMQGLVAAPGDEILYRDRMLACDLAGNPAGVETVMDELCEVVEALEPYDELHPETLALYERISHRKRTRQSHLA